MMDNFLTSLDIMWKGMFGIFTVIIIIALLVTIMQKISFLNPKDEDNN